MDRRRASRGLSAVSWVGGGRVLEPAGGGPRPLLPRGGPQWGRRPAPDEPTVPPPVDDRYDDGADISLIVDNSSSTAWTDPNGARHLAFRRILNLLVDGIGGDKKDDRVSVVCFADTPYAYCAPTRVRSRKGRRRLAQLLRPVSAGGTTIAPAIELAGRIARGPGSRTVTHLLFTDGESSETADDLNAAVDKLPPGSVHVVVLGDELPPQWTDVRVGSAEPITRLRGAEDVEWALARALYRSLDLQWPQTAAPTAAP